MQTIRRAGPGDEAEVYRLICLLEAAELPRAAFSQIYFEQAASGSHCFLVSEGENGRLNGVLHMQYEMHLHHAARVACVMDFCVDSAARGSGLGTRMFSAACEAAREAGCVHIELVSNNSRTRAHQFYIKQGMALDHAGFTMPL